MIYKVDLKGSFIMPKDSAVVTDKTMAKHIADITYVSPLLTFRPYFERQEYDENNKLNVYGSFTVTAYVLIHGQDANAHVLLETQGIDALAGHSDDKADALGYPVERMNLLLQGLEKELGMLFFTKHVTVCPTDLVPTGLAELYYTSALEGQKKEGAEDDL